MTNCVLCGNKTNVFSKKTLRGSICKSCLSYIPQGVSLEASENDYLRKLYEENRKKAEEFEATASYGSLYIDQSKGMFCVSERSANDKPLEFRNIYYAHELREIALFCADARNIGTNSNKIVCNVKFRVKTDKIHTEFVVARNKNCPFKIKGRNIDYDEPAELGMFRTMINQMLESTVLRYISMLEKIRAAKEYLAKEQKNEQWARGVMLFSEDEIINNESVRQRRNELIKLYHPDLDKETSSTDKAALINKAYDILAE